MIKSGAYVVSWDFSDSGDNGVLIVGRKLPGKPAEIVNVFEGKEALEMYRKLTTVKKGK